jgi:hypothetical protein
MDIAVLNSGFILYEFNFYIQVLRLIKKEAKKEDIFHKNRHEIVLFQHVLGHYTKQIIIIK